MRRKMRRCRRKNPLICEHNEAVLRRPHMNPLEIGIPIV
jgi:hypothetical protein